MALIEQIQKDMTAAMKGREEARLDAIRMIKAALQRYTIDTGKPLDEAAELQILNTLGQAAAGVGGYVSQRQPAGAGR